MRTVRWLLPAGLFVFGTVVNMYFAGMGYMPLDQSIVFDGGWRLLSGQMPFRDFVTPDALVPALMQVPFFRVFGVTWFAYCLHASIINGVFTAAVFVLLRTYSATRVEAAAFAALAAFLFYPPVGTPYMDQHAFCFGLLAMLAATAGSRSTRPGTDRIAWAIVSVALALAYLSKQIPTAFIAVCIATWVVLHPRQAPARIAAAAGGVVVVVLIILMAWVFVPFSASEAWRYLVSVPLRVGTERGAGRGVWASARLVFGTMRRLPSITGLWTTWVPASAIGILLVDHRRVREWQVLLWTCATTLLVTSAFVAFTVNEPQDGVGLIAVGAGAGFVVWREALASWLAPHGEWVRRRAIAGLTLVVMAVAARDLLVFVARIDLTRAVLDLRFDPAAASRGRSVLPAELSYLQWANDRYDAAEFSSLLGFLARQNGNFILIGDTSILYGLTQRPSIPPVLWFDPGLSMPRLDTAEFDELDNELLRRVRERDVRFVVDEGSTRGVTLASFRRLAALTARDQCREEHFGRTRVFELCAQR